MNLKNLIVLFLALIIGLSLIIWCANMVVEAASSTHTVASTTWVDIQCEIVDDGEESTVNSLHAENATYNLTHDQPEADSFDSQLETLQYPGEETFEISRPLVWFDVESENASFTYARIRLILVEPEPGVLNVSDTVAQHDVTHAAPEVPSALTDYEYSQYYTPYDARVTPTLTDNSTNYLNMNAFGMDYIKAVINGSYLNGADSYFAKWILRCYNDYADVTPFTWDYVKYFGSDAERDAGMPASFCPTLQLGYETVSTVSDLDAASVAMLYLIPIILAVFLISICIVEISKEFRDQ